jgi:ribosome-associated heat shock protein Hsp15
MAIPVRNVARLRIDKWLWFVRFFKSRAQASEAVDGGRIHLNGARVKASHAVCAGDQLEITRGRESWELWIRAIPARRGPAAEAIACYEESSESVARRAAARTERRLTGGAPPRPPKRPDKRARRAILRFQRGR